MTRSTNAQLAGFAYLGYIVVGAVNEVLMYRATSVAGTAEKLARIAEYSTDVRLAIILKLGECFSVFVLAVALYGITREENQELAILGLACRVAEGAFIASLIPNRQALLWLANVRAVVDARTPRSRMRWAHFCWRRALPSARSSSRWGARSFRIFCCADG